MKHCTISTNESAYPSIYPFSTSSTGFNTLYDLLLCLPFPISTSSQFILPHRFILKVHNPKDEIDNHSNSQRPSENSRPPTVVEPRLTSDTNTFSAPVERR